jgi:hypothetical protein
LIRYWRQQGVAAAGRWQPESVREFEVRNQVLLPPDLREYFLIVGGMKETAESAQDDRGFSFWSLSRVVPVDEVVEHHTPLLHHLTAMTGFSCLRTT